MNWYKLLKLADYEDQWAKHIEQLARDNPYPFSAWFGENGRTYFPLTTEQEGYDEDVAGALSDHGCEITDYRKGYCQQGNRSFRIGKFLQSMRKKDLQEVQQRHQQGELYNLEREVESINRYHDELMNTFENSTYRVSGEDSEFQVVVSQNPRDVAMMSTDRDWTSCMDLNREDEYHNNVFCEVRGGGLVAYLIRANDPEIRQPLARIHIRRFDNRQGQSIAIPEQSIYGNEAEGFSVAVKSWLDQQQGAIAPGIYQRQGGEYSDTFAKETLVSPTEQEDILKWFAEEDPNAQYSTWTVADKLYEYWRDDVQNYGDPAEDDIENFKKTFQTKEEAEKYLEIVKSTEQDGYEREHIGGEWDEFDEGEGEWAEPRFELVENKTDLRSQMKNEAIRKIIDAEKGSYSPEVLQTVKSHLLSDRSSRIGGERLLDSFIKKYPELLSEGEVKNLKNKDSLALFEALPEEKKAPLRQSWGEYIMRDLDTFTSTPIDQLHFLYDARNQSRDSMEREVGMKFNDMVLRPIGVVFKDQIPEPIIQKLIQYAQSLESGSFENQDHINGTLSQIVHTLSMAGADTPSVQQFYETLLPRWQNTFHNHYGTLGIDVLGHAIARLGENGKQFIPFIQGKIQEVENEKNEAIRQVKKHEENPGSYHHQSAEKTVKQWDKQLEKHLYVLDALQNGTGRSKKYKFFKSERVKKMAGNWYKRIKYASVTFSPAGAHKMSKPQDLNTISSNMLLFGYKGGLIDEEDGLTFDHISPDGGYELSYTGIINIYLTDKFQQGEAIELVTAFSEDNAGLFSMHLLRVDQSGMNPQTKVVRIQVSENETQSYGDVPQMNVSQDNAHAFLSMLANLGLNIVPDEYAGSISVDDYKRIRPMIGREITKMHAREPEESGGEEEEGPRFIGLGLDAEKIMDYVYRFDQIVAWIEKNQLPDRSIDFG